MAAPTFKISVVHDVDKLAKKLRRVERRAIPKATQAALNRAGRSTSGAALKGTAKELGLKQKVIKRSFSFFGAKLGRLQAAFRGRGRPLNLILFTAPSETRRKAFVRGGVRAKAGGKWKVEKGTFIANRGRTVFRRRSKIRTDLEGVTGGSVPETLATSEVKRIYERKFAERWPIELRRSLQRFIKRELR